MSNAQFIIGDVVRLKSNGRIMNIYGVEQESITCDWFDEKSNPGRDCFSLSAIEKVEGVTD